MAGVVTSSVTTNGTATENVQEPLPEPLVRHSVQGLFGSDYLEDLQCNIS